MIDPQYFQEPRRSVNAVVASWLYNHGFAELHKGSLRLSDKAACHIMFALFLFALVWA